MQQQGVPHIQGVPQIDPLLQFNQTKPVSAEKTEKHLIQVPAVDIATQVCGMVTNMSMNETHCTLLAFRASLTMVYWYLRHEYERNAL